MHRRSLRTSLPLAVGMAVAALSGCARVSSRAGFAGVERMVAERVPWQVRWVQGSAEDSLIEARVRHALRGEVSVDSAVQIAVLKNRSLRSTFEELGIAQADLAQAGLLANPVLGLSALDARGGGTGVRLGGLILPLVDVLQRPLRQRVSASALAATQQRLASAVVDLAAHVRMAYVEARGAEQELELWETVVAATDASAAAAGALHDAGNVSDLMLAQERAMAAESRLSLIRAVEERRVARTELGRLMGLTASDTGWSLSPRLPDPDTDSLSLAALLIVAQGRRLDLVARRQDVETQARALGLTRRFALLADGTISLDWEREPDGTFRGGGFSLPLPLFDRGQARIARARAQLMQSVAAHDALAVDISAEVASRYARLMSARDRAVQLRRTVVPLRRAVVAETQRFVNAMQETIFTLLVARQAEIDAGRSYIQSLREYWSLRAQLERAVGGSFAPLISDERADAPAGASGPSVSHLLKSHE